MLFPPIQQVSCLHQPSSEQKGELWISFIYIGPNALSCRPKNSPQVVLSTSFLQNVQPSETEVLLPDHRDPLAVPSPQECSPERTAPTSEVKPLSTLPLKQDHTYFKVASLTWARRQLDNYIFETLTSHIQYTVYVTACLRSKICFALHNIMYLTVIVQITFCWALNSVCCKDETLYRSHLYNICHVAR